MTEKTCAAFTKSGNPCKGRRLPGSLYCFAHQPEPDDPKALVLETVNEPEPVANACGHKNLHAFGPGRRLTCEKAPGHAGNHGTHFHRIDYRNGTVVFDDENAYTEWSDLAGIPPEEIKPDEKGLLEALRRRGQGEPY